ncbi:hypothetical protein VTO42DRAFT_1170 [Malbranchea cinnamomea]
MASLHEQRSWRDRQDERNGQNKDLNELLNPEQRRELIILVKRTIDLMEQFLNNHHLSSNWGYDDTTWPTPRSDENDNFDSKTYEKPFDALSQHDTGPKRSISSAEIKAEAELMRNFRSWRDSVLNRIGEVMKGISISAWYEKTATGGPSPIPDMAIPALSNQTADMLQDTPNGKFVPVETSLDELAVEARLEIINSLLLLLLSLKHYSAFSRTLLVHITSSLGLQTKDLIEQEIKVAKGLIVSVKEMSGEEEKRAKAEENRTARRWKVGLASVAGAALIGVTGGLAAPLVAAGIGSVIGTLGLGAVAGYLGAVAGSSVIIGGIFGAYGARMSGRMMERYTREVKDFAFIRIRSPPAPSTVDEKAALSSDHRLRVSIGISGWLTSEDDIVHPWGVLGDDSEVFALRWELRSLLRLGNALTTLVRNTAWAIAGREVLKRTILAPIVGALTLPLTLQKLSRLVDNPFRVTLNRADKAGEILAEALINRAQGERPVTLIGYSLGARVIFSCLSSLAR